VRAQAPRLTTDTCTAKQERVFTTVQSCGNRSNRRTRDPPPAKGLNFQAGVPTFGPRTDGPAQSGGLTPSRLTRSTTQS